MNSMETYEFDRQGYLVIENMLTPPQIASLATAIDALEVEALARMDTPPQKKARWGPQNAWESLYHHNTERGYFAAGSDRQGATLMIEDFFNADTAFDCLVDHARTMEYISEILQGPIRINNSEIRIRYTGNLSVTHMGGPIHHKYRYGFSGGRIDCMMVRMIYFLQEVSNAQGAFCVVPGTHKTNYPSPYQGRPDDEPGMIGLEVKAGDAILFTENLRHGGLTNQSSQVRKTLHIGYGPGWMMSQNTATMDEPQYILPQTLARYNARQQSLFTLPGWRQ
jgi:hypothetical protein